MEWYIADKTVKEDGSQTIRYELSGSGYAAESRKRAIAHGNRDGVWYHTTYWLIFPDRQEKQYALLALAKRTAEAIARAGS